VARTTDRETVVGVFLDEDMAQRALQALQSAGYQVRIADQSSLRNLSNMVGAEESRIYESRFNEGNTVVIVDAGDRGEDALGVMLQNGAEYINLHADETSRAGWQQGQAYDANYYQNIDRTQRQYGQYDESLGRARSEDEIRVLLREETLTPVKRAEQAGEVEIRKTVHEEQREVPVTLRHEEVTVERHAVDRPLREGEMVGDLQDDVIRVPVYQEQADLEKQARVVEEVVVDKDVIQEQQTLTGTVRREDIDIQKSGDVTRADTDFRTQDR